MRASPKLRISELMDEIIALTDYELDQRLLPLKRLTNRVNDLINKQINVGKCFAALGIIEALRNNITESVNNFENALRIDPNDSKINYNYSVTLYQFSLYNEAANQAKAGFTKDETDNVLLELLIDSCFRCGRFNEAKTYYIMLERRFGEERFKKVKHSWIGLDDIINFLDAKAINESDITSATELASQFLIEKQIIPINATTYFEKDEFLAIDYYIDLPADMIDELQAKFEDELWKYGLSEKFNNSFFIEFNNCEESKSIEDQLDVIEDDIKQGRNLVPLSEKFLNEVKDLLEEGSR